MWLTLFSLDAFSWSPLQWNNTNTMPLHSQHHTVLSDLQVDKWHSLIISDFFSKIELITKSTTHQSLTPWYLPLLGHVITKSLPNTLPYLPIGCQASSTSFSASHWFLRFAAHYKFTDTNYYSNFVILHASQWQNHMVYWLNPAWFYCKYLDYLASPCT